MERQKVVALNMISMRVITKAGLDYPEYKYIIKTEDGSYHIMLSSTDFMFGKYKYGKLIAALFVIKGERKRINKCIIESFVAGICSYDVRKISDIEALEILSSLL